MSFAKDKEWIQAKKIAGVSGDWLDVLSYYKSIGGRGVEIHLITPRGLERLIGYEKSGETAIIETKEGNFENRELEDIKISKKIFKYNLS